MKISKKKYTKKSVYKSALTTISLLLLVIFCGYIIFQTEWLKPKLNELSASYISLNNLDTTDILKVSNLRKYNNKNGKSNWNKSVKIFQVTGQREMKYQIVLYHVGEKIEDEYIHFYLENEKGVTKEETLSNQFETEDGGKVIYEGTIKEGKNWTLKMWIDKKYKKKENNISYEIRIKTN